MIRRILFIVTVAAALLALVIYSQTRSSASYVSGLVEAEEIRLGSRIGGRVKSVLVMEGDPVAAGTKLVEFEAYDLKQREQEAIAQLAEREAALRKFKSGMRAEEIAQTKARFDQAISELRLLEAGPRPEEISAAENRVKAATAELQFAKGEFARMSKMIRSKAISKSEFERASERLEVAAFSLGVRQDELSVLKAGARVQEIDIAKAKVEDLRLAWELAKQGFRVEEIEQATAARDAAAAALDLIRKQLEELVVFAPSDGTVDALDLQPGDLVGPNAPVMTMLSQETMWVRAYVPQRFLQLHVGQRLQVTFDSFPGEEFTGEVSFISRQAEFTPSNVQTPDDRAKQVYRVRVALRNEAEKLRPGMTANVWLESESPEE